MSASLTPTPQGAVAGSAARPSSSAPRGQTLSGIVFVFAADALMLPTGLVTAGFLTRHLGPADYGRFTLAATLVAWAQWTVSSLFSRAVIRYAGESEDWQPVATTALRLHLVAGLALGAMLAAASGGLAGVLHEPDLVWYLLWLAIDVPLFSAAQAHLNVLVGIGQFRARAAASAARWIGRLLLMLVLVGAGFSVPGAIAANIGASCLELAICRVWIRPSPAGPRALPARALLGLALPLMAFALGLRVFDKLDLLMLKALGGTAAEAGFYGAAQNLSLIPLVFAAAVSTLVLSTMSRMLRDGDRPAARDLARNAMRAGIALLPFAALAAGASLEIVTLVFGREFAPAAPVLALLIFAGVGMATMVIGNGILAAVDAARASAIALAPLLPLALLLHWLVIPAFGSAGAAAVTASLALLGGAAALALVRWACDASPSVATAARAAVISLVVYQAAWAWPAPGAWLFLKLAAIAALVPPAFAALGEFSAAERRLLLAGVRARRRSPAA